MSRLLALEWNAVEARVAVVGSRGEQPVVECAFSIDLRPAESESEEERSAVDAGQRIAAALAARHLSKLDTLVAIGRTNIELRKLSLPPVPDAELAELVRFQALREFNALEADWPLDFLPIDESPAAEAEASAEPAMRSVLAAAIDPEIVAQVHETCNSAGLKPRRLVLRPCAAAALLCRYAKERLRPVTLLVDLLLDEADLTVICDRQVVFLRTARLPGDPLVDEMASTVLVSEIRRTVAAAQNQIGGRRIESITLCGSGKLHTELAATIQGQLGTSTELFDPFEKLSLSTELSRALPDHPGRFAPLLGTLLDEMDQTPHALDFLHPRQPPKPPSRRNLYVGIGAGAAALVALLVLGTTLYGRGLQSDIDELNKQSAALDKQVDEAKKLRDAVAEIDKWRNSDFCWLDELRWLSENAPPAKDARLTKLMMQSPQGQKQGRITIDGLAKDAAAIQRSERALRDSRHTVDSGSVSQDASDGKYGWTFGSSINVDHEAP